MRKRHVQQDLPFTRKRKPGGGRKPKNGKRAGEPHARRVAFSARDAVHVVLRSHKDVGYLRKRHIYQAVRRALIVTFTREDFRIVHQSLQGTHIHLLIEAADRHALARGMQAFEISAAKHINAAISKNRVERRRGAVFPDRYHVEIINSRRGARHALAYVLNNWRKHEEHYAMPDHRIDPFSTASTFDGWADVADPAAEITDLEPMPVWKPKTWLLREGWKMYGLIRWRETPRSGVHRRRS